MMSNSCNIYIYIYCPSIKTAKHDTRRGFDPYEGLTNAGGKWHASKIGQRKSK